MRGPAVLAGKARPRGKQDRRVRNRVDIEVVRRQLPVGTGRRAVEEQGKTIRRPDLAEDDGRIEGVIDTEPANVDALA